MTVLSQDSFVSKLLFTLIVVLVVLNPTPQTQAEEATAAERLVESSPSPYKPAPHRDPLFAGVEEAGEQVEGMVRPWKRLSDDWMGLRPKLEEHGIVFDGSVTADISSNFHGGANTNGGSFRHLLNLNFTVNTEQLAGWKNGTFFLNFQNHNGEDGSGDTGDIQAYSNIDSDGRTEIAELWYEHVFMDGKLRIKIGKVEVNSEFAFVDNGGEFINSSMGFSPTIFVFPTYPDPATSVNVFVYPTENIYAGVGVYDGATQEGKLTGSRGPKTFFGKPSDLFVIGEFGITWECGENKLPGRLGVGGWGHTGTFTRFDSTTDNGTSGFYLVLDQALCRENPEAEDDGQGVGAFFQFGQADQDVSEIETHVGAGLSWVGPIPGRDEDVAGVGATYVQFSDDTNAGFTDDHEIAYEAFYKIQVWEWVTVKPDIQYIRHPGGGSLKDATVGTLRVEVAF